MVWRSGPAGCHGSGYYDRTARRSSDYHGTTRGASYDAACHNHNSVIGLPSVETTALRPVGHGGSVSDIAGSMGLFV